MQKTANDNASAFPEAASVKTENFTRTIICIRSRMLHMKLGLAVVWFRTYLGGFSLSKFVSNGEQITLALRPETYKTPSLRFIKICNGAKQSSHVLCLK